MTHWNNEPIMMGASGFKVEAYNGQYWIRQEDIPIQKYYNDRIVFE